jgi:hypothetical protein
MKRLGRISTFAALAASLTFFSSHAMAGDAFAAGAAQISATCHFEFDARSTGGNVTEQCDFGEGKVVFHGPVLCFAASGNRATFVWLLQIAPYNQGYYQQVTVVDNGAPGQGVPDLFSNYSESLSNPCPTLTPDTGGSPVLKGNFVVSSEE